MRRLGVAAGALTLVATAGSLVAAAPSASADEPEISSRAGQITYTDPALADEDTESVTGTLQVVVVDRRDGEVLLFGIRTRSGRTVPIEPAADLPERAANGRIQAQVVDGGSNDGELAAATVAPAAVPSVPTASAHRAYVVRATDTGPLPSLDTVSADIATQSLAEWAAETPIISSFTVAGTADLDSTQSASTQCGASSAEKLWGEASAKFPGVSFGGGTGNHLIVLLSGAGCGSNGALGLGDVGSSIADGGRTIVQWNLTGTGASDPISHSTVVHELGHNFSLGHANVRDGSTSKQYLDVYSVMGYGVPAGRPQAIDTAYRDTLGIAEDGEVAAVAAATGEATSTQQVTIEPRGSTTGRRAVRATDPITDRSYWVEYRDDRGRDTDAAYGIGRRFGSPSYTFDPGVTITQKSTTSRNALELLPRTGRNGSWTAGTTFRTASGGLAVRVDSTGSSAQVTVTVATRLPQIATAGENDVARVGEPATASDAGWPDGTTFTHAWTLDGQPAGDADTYTPVPGQQGDLLRVATTGTPPDGLPSTVMSAPVTVGLGRQVVPADQAVSGTLKVGRTIKASRPGWPTGTTFSVFRWYRSTSKISNAYSSSYKLVSKDRGKRTRFCATASRSGYEPKRFCSPYVGPTK